MLEDTGEDVAPPFLNTEENENAVGGLPGLWVREGISLRKRELEGVHNELSINKRDSAPCGSPNRHKSWHLRL